MALAKQNLPVAIGTKVSGWTMQWKGKGLFTTREGTCTLENGNVARFVVMAHGCVLHCLLFATFE